MGTSLLFSGDIAQSRAHLDHAFALYNPVEHRPLATRFGHEVRVSILTYRSWAQWMLGYPEAARRDAEQALTYARESGQAAALLYTAAAIPLTHIFCGDYAAANAQADAVVALADEKGTLFWKAMGIMDQGCVLAMTGRVADAIRMIASGITAWRSVGGTALLPFYLSYLARAHAELGQFDDTWRCIGEAMSAVEKTKERWCEAEVNRIAGEVALLAVEPDATKAQAHFERSLSVAGEQQAKSWELRAAMSLARLWRDQGKAQQARELLAPVYGWFTEGFDTRDLKEAKALMEELDS